MTKPKLAYLLATDQVIQDAASNKFSYIGLFQTITIPKDVGFYYVDFSIVGRIYNIKKGNITARMEIIGPDEKLFAKVDLTGATDSDEAHLYGRFNGTKFSQKGIYTYHLIHQGATHTTPGNYIEVFEK